MKPAILVIDMLNDFVNGKLACLQAKAIVRPIQRMLLIARKKHIPIIYTNDAHSKNKDKELKLWGEHAIKGTEGAQIIPELKPTKSDIIIEKHHFSGFFQTKLQQILSKLKIDTLIIVGLQTHICVLHTIADAYQ
jgi:nicotinamidase-related amidase